MRFNNLAYIKCHILLQIFLKEVVVMIKYLCQYRYMKYSITHFWEDMNKNINLNKKDGPKENKDICLMKKIILKYW